MRDELLRREEALRRLEAREKDTDQRFGLVARAYPSPDEVEQAAGWLLDAAEAYAEKPHAPRARDAVLSAARGYTRLYDRLKGGN